MAPPTRPRIVIELDVGKSAHWACVVTRDGEALASNPSQIRVAARPYRASARRAAQTQNPRLAQTERGTHRRQPIHPSVQPSTIINKQRFILR